MKLHEGDKVMVVAGKDKGRESRISRVLPDGHKIIVEGVNTAKRHERVQGQTMQGGIIDKDMPIDVSNVMLMCDTDGPTRIGSGFDSDGKKFRRCVKCDKEL